MAARRRYDTVGKLARGIDGYFAGVERHNREHPEDPRHPTWPGLCLYLDVSYDTVERWMENADQRYAGFGELMGKASMRLQEAWEQTGFAEPRKASLSIFMLRQRHYGGYTDRPAAAPEGIRVRVELGGMGQTDAFG